jgi:tetratricopeptide (TPR) repeat protein
MAKIPKSKLTKYNQFTQIYRNNYRIIIFGIFVSILILIFIAVLKLQGAYSDRIYQTTLAFFQINDLESAKKFIIYSSKYSNNNIQSVELLNEILNIEKQTSKIKSEIYYVNQTLVKYPLYRDGWFKLSLLYWQIYRDNDAKFALERSLEIDPNFKPALNFNKYLNN